LGLSAAAFKLREDDLRRSTDAPSKPRQTVFTSRWVEEGPEPFVARLLLLRCGMRLN
jgi:hypothetical protein